MVWILDCRGGDSGALACDVMPGTLEAAQLLNVDVDQLAGVLLFVAADRHGGLQGRQARRLRIRLTVAGETPTSVAICLPVQRRRRKASTRSRLATGVDRCKLCGRQERSLSPSTPSALKRATHLRTVRGQAQGTAARWCVVALARRCILCPALTPRGLICSGRGQRFLETLKTDNVNPD